MSLATIRIHPVKSLGGFAVQQAKLTDRGLQHDRRWMLVDPDGRFLSQREIPAMACLRCAPQGDGFRVTDIRNGEAIDLPWSIASEGSRMASVWSDLVRVEQGNAQWSTWFSARLGADVQLVFMPEATHRRIDGRYAKGHTSLSDGFPYLIVSQASLDDLNARLDAPVPMDRFRPNLVIAGGAAFQEDAWKEVAIGGARFQLVKPCARCVITATDQSTGERGKEPLRTLATYRARDGKVLFGMNAAGLEGGVVRVGDLVAP
ncbi:MAG: MOSC domain-containing protein [Flavobacteriales bacterium]|nr:MOSC domain-containing protein [Flavobacteriales bacterium]